ncbi:hypothetical protein DFQ26_006502 [Actinomortierella ambigua]|nr:hypothetical protein DFQ26_006502 [Actinomortierella ambigua]
MKLNLAIAFAAVASLITIQAAPTAPEGAEAAEHGSTLTGRRYCCQYAKSGQWCGATGCCLWSDYCLQYGGPAQCGYSGCCMKYGC